MTITSARIRAGLDRRFVIGIALLALASTATFWASLSISRTESHRAEAISLVAGQRALSQRIAFLVAALGERPSEAMAAELDAAADAMARGHDLLTMRVSGEHDLSRFLEPIQGVYFSGYMPFDLAAQRFIDDAHALAALDPESEAWAAAAPTRAYVVSAGTDSMMQTHDLMVRIMEVEAQAAVTRAERADAALWAFVLCLLGAITFGIYLPIRRHVARSVTELEAARAEADDAARAADAANEAKGHFLQAASHELKTPLNAITGFADVLRERVGEPEDGEDALAQMQLASEHLSVLLDAILDTHRADEGTLVLNDEPFEPAPVFENVARLGQSLAARKGLRFEAAVDVGDAMLRGDAGRLRQLCLNLIDNAVKFTEAGSVRLEAEVEAGEGEADLVVRVIDTGRGIAPAQLGAVFERFNASGEITARGGGGLGIGLALTRQMAELMGGRAEIDSEEGRGTCAKLTLRLPVVARAPLGLEVPEAAGERAPRVLIVDDNAPNRMVAEALVKSCGGLTVLCADGAQAVEAAGAAAQGGQPFDLILMDISMPVMDGIQATKAIRAGGGTGFDVPIVAVTAHVAQSDAPAMLAQGFDAVIHKPVRRDLIEDAMRRWAACEDEPDADADTAADMVEAV